MADRYLLESGSPDGYRLEDGSGVLLLETTATYDAAFFASISQLVESYRYVRNRSLYQDGERKVTQGTNSGEAPAPAEYGWFTYGELTRAYLRRAKLSVHQQTKPNDGWMAFAANIIYDPLTMSGWIEPLGGFRARSSLRYQRDTNRDITWPATLQQQIAGLAPISQLSESFRNVRDRSLYQDFEKRPVQGTSTSGSATQEYAPEIINWTIPSYLVPRKPYWTSAGPSVDWINNPVVAASFNPATHPWAIRSEFVRKTRPTQMAWTKSGFFVPMFHSPAEFNWTIDSQRVPGGPWWTSPDPNVDWIDPTVRTTFDTKQRSGVIDSQRVPAKPYWTSQWQGNDWITPELLAQIAFNPANYDWTIKTHTYKSRAWWSDSPQQQAWMVPSAKFDPKLWPATGLPSHRELPKSKGLWQPDLDNAWQVPNPVVPNFFNASFVTNANIVEDAGGSPERSS